MASEDRPPVDRERIARFAHGLRVSATEAGTLSAKRLSIQPSDAFWLADQLDALIAVADERDRLLGERAALLLAARRVDDFACEEAPGECSPENRCDFCNLRDVIADLDAAVYAHLNAHPESAGNGGEG